MIIELESTHLKSLYEIVFKNNNEYELLFVVCGNTMYIFIIVKDKYVKLQIITMRI